MDNLFKGIVYLTTAQFEELSAHGTITVGDITVEYDPDNTLYLTSDDTETETPSISNISDLEVSIDDNYKMKFKLLGNDGDIIGTEKEIDLPLETVVVGGTYNNGTKEIQLTLQNGNKVKIPVEDLVSGLVPTTRKINGKTLDSDINLSAEDLGISLDGEPTIQANDGILTIQKNGTNLGTFTANQSGNSTINIEMPVFEETSKKTFTFFNNNTLKNGVYLLKYGADVYYGHENYQSDSDYKFSLPSGSALIYQRHTDWNSSGGFGGVSFQAFESSDIYNGNTNYYSSSCSHFPMPTKYTSDGKPMLNRVPKIVDSNGTMQWIEPEYYTKAQINAKTINSKPLSSNITLTASDITTTYGDNDSVQKVLEDFEDAMSVIGTLTINSKEIIDNPVLTASDVGALPDTTTIPTRVGQLINDSEYVDESTLNNKAASLGSDINLTLDTTNYKITAQLVNSTGTALGTAKTIDLPLETMVVGASYDDATEKIVLTLKNGTTTSFSVADLVKGLVSDTRTINGKPLSSNITLSASDVGALPSTTTIPTVNNGTLTIQKNGTTVKTFTANSSSNVTANIEVPTGTAADKNYTTTMDNSDNLPTAAAIQAYVTSRGYVTSSGSVASATNANSALTATNATNDAGGNNIATTYAKKTDLGTQTVFTLSGTTLTIVPK